MRKYTKNTCPKIKAHDLNYFNSRPQWPCENDNFNIANNLPTVDKYNFMHSVAVSTFGAMCYRGEKLTRKHINEYIETL